MPYIMFTVDQDGAEPSPNSVSASNLHRFSCYLNKEMNPSPVMMYTTFRDMLTKAPAALSGMLESFLWNKLSPKQVSITCIYILMTSII